MKSAENLKDRSHTKNKFENKFVPQFKLIKNTESDTVSR